MSSNRRQPDPVVHIVDDDPAVLRSIRRFLMIEGFETRAFDSPSVFLAEHDPEVPGCVVLDLSMPTMDGLEVQRCLALAGGAVPRPVIFLTGHGDVPQSVAAMKGGAVDFLTKPVDADALVDAVRRALAADAAARSRRGEFADVESRLASLTPREREVMVHVVSGKLNKQVAALLGTTEKTIKVHRGRVMEKMAAESLADLVRMSINLSLSSLDVPPER